jgi:hypothetical protein
LLAQRRQQQGGSTDHTVSGRLQPILDLKEGALSRYNSKV